MASHQSFDPGCLHPASELRSAEALILILAVGPAMAAFMGEDEEEGYE
jgi:hypothetical protein